MKKEAVALDIEIKASNEITAQQKQLWSSVKEKYEVILDSVKSMKDGIKSSGIATYCKDVLQGLKSIAKTAPKAIKEKLTKMAKNIQALMKTLTVQSGPNREVLGTNPKLDKYVINPNKPAMKISQDAKDLASDWKTSPEHVQFCLDNKELFKGNKWWECWSEFKAQNPKHGAWKMHLYSVDEKDWQKMSEVLIPYLRDHDIDWKTFNMANGADHLNGGIQKGKAFTIYPRDNAHMEQVAKDLDYIIRNNNLETKGSSIVGDRAMGDNGRLFYRYEFKTGTAQHEVLDLSPNSKDWNRYKELYDGNSARVNRHGEGRYLADDMTAADDPWLNFNPADPKSHATYNRNNRPNVTLEPEVILAADNFNVGDKLPKEQGVVMTPNSKLLLADQIELDLSSPQIQSRLKNLKDGETLTIGREGDIVVGANNDLISRKHLTIEKYGNEIIVKDISRNGTKFRSLGDDVKVVSVESVVHPIDVNLNPRSAIEQTGKFNSTHRIDVGEKVLDGYKDAGRKVQFDSNGNIINPEKVYRETIVVDRTKDKKLQHLISDVKQKTKKMSEQQKADFLMEYIYNLTGDGNIAAGNCKKWTKNNVGQDALLGDIVTNNPPVAVCRHRGLLFKVLGDEVGLKIELQRGNFYVDANNHGGHAWNTVRFSDGTSAIYDAMHHRKASTTPGQIDDYALYYQDTKGNRLYDRGLSNNINNANVNKSK